jgi:hypothetical protein
MQQDLVFSHPSPLIKTNLVLYVKPDQMVWSYGLNTANFPTYGGEVVQILSMFVEDMSISGTVVSYSELENIYSWFVNYMHIASQGDQQEGKSSSYDSRPVHLWYPHRNWHFDIYPKSLPNFKYGRDVVAPTWQLQAAVSEFPDSFQDSVLSEKEFIGVAKEGNFDPFGTVTADIGFTQDSKWSGMTKKQLDGKEDTDQAKKTADEFGGFLKTWLDENKYDALNADYSVPKWMQQ